MNRVLQKVKLCVLMIGLSMPTGAWTQAPSKPVPPDEQEQTVPQEPGKSATSEPTASVQTFEGTIIKERGSYVLKDSTGASYQLDDQKRAKEFIGQKVTVNGTVDPSSKMIRVASITPSS